MMNCVKICSHMSNHVIQWDPVYRDARGKGFSRQIGVPGKLGSNTVRVNFLCWGKFILLVNRGPTVLAFRYTVVGLKLYCF